MLSRGTKRSWSIWFPQLSCSSISCLYYIWTSSNITCWGNSLANVNASLNNNEWLDGVMEPLQVPSLIQETQSHGSFIRSSKVHEWAWRLKNLNVDIFSSSGKGCWTGAVPQTFIWKCISGFYRTDVCFWRRMPMPGGRSRLRLMREGEPRSAQLGSVRQEDRHFDQ